MKVAIIAPLKYLQFVDRADIAFALTQFVNNDQSYRDFYKDTQKYTILDNGAAEMGKSADELQVIEAMKKINADEVWAPDELYNSKNTIHRTKLFLENMPNNLIKRTTVALIPQGNSISQWITCYKQLLRLAEEYLSTYVICMSKYSCRCFGGGSISKSRIKCIQYLLKQQLIDNGTKYHLAGAGAEILQEIAHMRQYPFIRSIDSNIAVKMGIHRRLLGRNNKEPAKRLDFHLNNLTKDQISCINYNITRVLEAARN